MRISDWSSDVCSSDLQQILDEIEDYNRIDCQSTQLLRDWLVGIRPDGPWPVLAQDAAEQEVVEDEETTALRDRLAASSLTPERQELLFNLGLFHKREAKPARSEEHTSELQSLMRISYAVFCLKKQKQRRQHTHKTNRQK